MHYIIKFRPLFRHAWRGLLLHKLRSLLSTLGIVFAVVAVVAMLAIAEGAKVETLEQIEQLGTNSILVRPVPMTEIQQIKAREGLSGGLSWADVHALRKVIPGLTSVAPITEISAAVKGYNNEVSLIIFAVSEAYQAAKNLTLAKGRFITRADTDRRNLVCVLGAETENLLNRSTGGRGLSIGLEDSIYRVVGVLHPRRWVSAKIPALASRNYNRAIFIPFGAEPAAYESGASYPVGRLENFGEFSEIVVKVGSGANVVSTAEAVKHVILQNHGGLEDFQVVLPRELLHQAQRTQQVFNIVLGAIAGISLLVGGIGIMNIMLASVSERTREIGIRRAIGARRGQISAHFLCESILLTVIGGLIGLALGVGTAALISNIAGWRTAIRPWSMILALLMAGGVGVISGLYPAIKASRVDPVEALR